MGSTLDDVAVPAVDVWEVETAAAVELKSPPPTLVLGTLVMTLGAADTVTPDELVETLHFFSGGSPLLRAIPPLCSLYKLSYCNRAFSILKLKINRDFEVIQQKHHARLHCRILTDSSN